MTSQPKLDGRVIDPDWCSPIEALDLLEAHHGAATKDLIADKLKDGRIRARAEEAWESDEPNLSSAWKSRDEYEPERNIEITMNDWCGSRHWDFDKAQWRWPKNRFVITRRKKPADRLILRGLSFHRRDIDALVPQAVKPVRKGGRPPDAERWTNFWLCVAEVAHEGRLSTNHFQSQAELRRELLEMGNHAFAEETIKESVRRIWQKFVDEPRTP